MQKILMAWVFISLILLVMLLEEKKFSDENLDISGRDTPPPAEPDGMLADFVDFGAHPLDQCLN